MTAEYRLLVEQGSGDIDQLDTLIRDHFHSDNDTQYGKKQQTKFMMRLANKSNGSIALRFRGDDETDVIQAVLQHELEAHDKGEVEDKRLALARIAIAIDVLKAGDAVGQELYGRIKRAYGPIAPQIEDENIYTEWSAVARIGGKALREELGLSAARTSAADARKSHANSAAHEQAELPDAGRVIAGLAESLFRERKITLHTQRSIMALVDSGTLDAETRQSIITQLGEDIQRRADRFRRDNGVGDSGNFVTQAVKRYGEANVSENIIDWLMAHHKYADVLYPSKKLAYSIEMQLCSELSELYRR